jgi:hypothetical protein
MSPDKEEEVEPDHFEVGVVNVGGCGECGWVWQNLPVTNPI